MQRRQFVLSLVGGLASATLMNVGCRGRQVAHVLKEDDQDMVGSHAAGAETWKPLVETAMAQLLARQVDDIRMTSAEDPASADFGKKRICFVGIENKSSEEIGDFKEQIYDHIDTLISQSDSFKAVHRRYIEAGLEGCNLRVDDLFKPANQRAFVGAMERINHPFDYLMYAKITSGTTQNNKSSQKDYQLVLEVIDIHTGDFDKESATIRKGYHKSGLGKLKNYGAG